MDRKCKNCNERMMIAQEGKPPYTGGYWTIYGCPECGNLEYSYEDTISNMNIGQANLGDLDLGDNPIQWHYDSTNLRHYAVSN